ncbi:CDP-glycerol--glycerophosphate glycerophosphotransferase [Terribacillus saccharophilus]|uniref:CDP-glycerol--glycerophosphate glycerophosphotransferase n=1 Tax=Terribacillus saccharophilus TaxID=361277 RepID=A0A268HI80_9BACI|nr:CDP-glycerol--glycerophosphate glycerophosphotransferase [Terribacillus saccharophilus]
MMNVKNKLKNTALRAYKVGFHLMGKVLPVNKKLIIFESFLGKQFSDNPRALYEHIQNAYPEYQLYWSVDSRYVSLFERKGIPHIKRFSLQWMFKMTRARYWITNSRLPLWIPKPTHTTYLQTWHGTPLKKLAADMEQVLMPGTDTEKYKRNFKKEASKWDYLISPNAYSSEIFRRAFSFDKSMLETGYPRNDYLINSNNQVMIDHLKVINQLPKDKKIILYAPTWRDNQFYGKGKYKFDLELDLKRMREQLGDEYIVLLRLHYLVSENIELAGLEGFAYDFSAYEDIRDLYLISDVLITDYSSVFFDYANLRRPMFFFVYDIEDYRNNLRGFYLDFEKEAPGPLFTTTKEIIKELKLISIEPYKQHPNFQAFYEKFCSLEDGQASKRVIETLLEK